ncbi:MAG: hypothetical protein AAB504_01225, partial [Patescibacteria group bacterium]
PELAKILNKPLTEFLPEELKKVGQMDIGKSINEIVEKTKEIIKKPLIKLGETGEKISEPLIAGINRINPAKRQQFYLQQGVSEEQWLKERGIIGTRHNTIAELAKRFKALRENVDTALEKIPGNYREQRIITVADEAAEVARATENPRASRMVSLAEKAKGEGLTTKEINEVKQFYEQNVKVAYKKDITKTSEQVQRATNRDTGIREALFEIADKAGFKELGEINKEIQASKFLGDEIAGKMQGQAANNMMSLTDWIAITPGAIDPSFLSGFAAKKIFSTETVRAFAAKVLAGFPEKKALPQANMDEIIRRAKDFLIRAADIKLETEKSALLYDELQKSGFKKGVGENAFIIENPIPLTREEQTLIRAAKNKAEQ